MPFHQAEHATANNSQPNYPRGGSSGRNNGNREDLSTGIRSTKPKAELVALYLSKNRESHGVRGGYRAMKEDLMKNWEFDDTGEIIRKTPDEMTEYRKIMDDEAKSSRREHRGHKREARTGLAKMLFGK